MTEKRSSTFKEKRECTLAGKILATPIVTSGYSRHCYADFDKIICDTAFARSYNDLIHNYRVRIL